MTGVRWGKGLALTVLVALGIPGERLGAEVLPSSSVTTGFRAFEAGPGGGSTLSRPPSHLRLRRLIPPPDPS